MCPPPQDPDRTAPFGVRSASQYSLWYTLGGISIPHDHSLSASGREVGAERGGLGGGWRSHRLALARSCIRVLDLYKASE